MPTPTFGGIAVFIGFVLAMILVSGSNSIFGQGYVFAALIIIFFMGVKDDIIVLDPLKKLYGQIIAALILVFFADIRITNLFGIFHVNELPYIVSLLLTVFVFIVVINGFNLIDGIDGLASGTGILSSIMFAVWFWADNDISYSIFCFSFAGSLSAFFMYNVFGHKNKIFLGDTGSMLIGFILSILACHFLQDELVAPVLVKIETAPSIVIAVLFIPLYDSLRVFIIRISNGKSPFKADRQHLHHRLLQLGFSHFKATIILMSFNLLFILISIFCQSIGAIKLICIMVLLAVFLSNLLVNLAIRRTKKLNELELQLAEFLKKLYRNKDGIIRSSGKIHMPIQRTHELSRN
jgi:UDP-GlcNAc:undecaprenyl-phosphate/decaprenyl-phosphate GlcNAc-1-phosphate transferase